MGELSVSCRRLPTGLDFDLDPERVIEWLGHLQSLQTTTGRVRAREKG
jgi:hypothetical protein